MTIIPFTPLRPTAASLTPTAYMLIDRFPRWDFEVGETDDGIGWVVAAHRTSGHSFGSQWSGREWVVFDSASCAAAGPRSPDLLSAFEHALAAV